MRFNSKTLHQIDLTITDWMAKKGLLILRISIGIIFLWFGGIKYFDSLSPAEDIAIQTIRTITFGFVSDQFILHGLATWEVLIGIGLLFRIFLRETLLLLYLQMIGTFMPVFLFPQEVFNIFPYSLTMEGQYIIKNVVVLSAGIVLGATVRGGGLVPE